ncbi:serine--tRNA ligase, mitochondrial-like [Ruditapes philippinarum]|uniref:serine--tRNA ligase, mitochondrial-like n=1 Tax=Ruditapes philippinarum TaxID=129788 RepID=UPI00295BF1A9|nr:serine--tRNA ligase, mitochondrial-like [Ruditapes philippinarum]XP_060562047.1 serine--tRNA ligase, mitochondrial-like [Ruditapes philippinarum]
MRAVRSACFLLRRNHTLSWSRLRRQIQCLHTSVSCSTESSTSTDAKHDKYNQWNVPFQLKEPEYDFDYILDPDNLDAIRDNIAQRKGVGNIDLVVDLHRKFVNETNPGEKEKVRREFIQAVGEIPNISHPHSPVGEEDAAKLVDLVGTKREVTAGQPPLKTMLELGEQLGMLRTSNVAMTTGHTTYYFLDQFAMLEQALIRYTVDYLLHKGFQLVSVPDLLRPEIIESCGFKTTGDVAQVYRLDQSRHPDLCLIGTSEMSLAGYFMDEVQKANDLPIKLAAVSRCYRAETSRVEEELGLYRVHQFTKVEMFGVTGNKTGEEGNELLHELTEIEKTLFSQLDLHFRILDMPTAELGAPAHRKFDFEAWMPARQFWGEISSASNCTDYQSRRLHIKYRTDNDDDEIRHCTTVSPYVYNISSRFPKYSP